MGDRGVVGQRLLRGAQRGLGGGDLLVVRGRVPTVDGADGEAGVADRVPARGQRDLSGPVGGAEVGADVADERVERGAPVAAGAGSRGQLAWRRRSACCVADGRRSAAR
ncbi:hypothetical protein NHL50_18580 [Acidimicrobiia bacterium EGI L10123]|uniref:hypothetical protein n=1 Tax=Salinilacustrithrix flava TaxID=2957203 RepID=UPI003D7C1F17|nr:hypothetical protein [Acidimicrobiia bacterium EGI L10123]